MPKPEFIATITYVGKTIYTIMPASEDAKHFIEANASQFGIIVWNEQKHYFILDIAIQFVPAEVVDHLKRGIVWDQNQLPE